MSAVAKFQMGMTSETTWNSESTVTRFFELESEAIQPEYKRVESAGLRAGNRALRADRFMPYFFQAAGPIKIPVLSKGFGVWLGHMLGASATTGPTDSVYTHTGTFGDILAKGFTSQFNRPLHPADTNQAFTFTGGKVHKWALSNKVDEVLIADLDVSFAGLTTATSLAAASYPSGTVEPLTFVGATLQIASSSTSIAATSFKVECDNKLDRGNYLRLSGAKKEPVETALREVTWEIEADFSSTTQRDRFAAATAAGTVAVIQAQWTGAILVGSTTYPSLTVTIPAARFDGDDPVISGPDPLSVTYKGMGLQDTTGNSPVTVAYATADSAA